MNNRTICVKEIPYGLEYIDSRPSIVYPNGAKHSISIATAIQFEMLAKLDEVNQKLDQINTCGVI